MSQKQKEKKKKEKVLTSSKIKQQVSNATYSCAHPDSADPETEVIRIYLATIIPTEVPVSLRFRALPCHGVNINFCSQDLCVHEGLGGWGGASGSPTHRGPLWL